MPDISEVFFDYFPTLRDVDDDAVRELVQSVHPVTLPPGTKVFESGARCENYLMVAKGRIRVQQLSESGREIVLYRIGDGETCILTTACLLAHQDYAAEAITETEVTGYAVPRTAFDHLLARSARFRDFVFRAYASRITDLIMLVEEIAFSHVDTRLAKRLLDLAPESDTISVTHQELAVELGTAREVISRQLKEFERRGWIRLERGSVVIENRKALNDFVRDSTH